MFKTTGFVCLVALILSGCGSSYSNNNNGSGSGGTTSYTGQAQGVYSGTASNGYSFSSIILPNDKFYGIYGTVSGNVLYIYGMVAGQGTSGNNTFTASSITDYLNTGATFSDTLSATDVPGASISGTITETTPITFNGNSLPNGSFNYNTAASVPAISGSWTGTLLDGMTTTATIGSNGTLSGSSSGCSFSGTITADSSGKNFFNVSLTFGGSPCAAPNQTATGVAVYYLLPDGVTHQLLAGVTSGNNLGTVFFAER